MDTGDAIEKEFIQTRFISLLQDDKLTEAFEIYHSVDEEMKSHMFHFVCGVFTSTYKIMTKLLEDFKED